MSKLIRVSGSVMLCFTQVVEVEDDFDPELHEPDLEFDDIVDVDSQDITIDSVESWSVQQESDRLGGVAAANKEAS